jgi:hypothetical protein
VRRLRLCLSADADRAFFVLEEFAERAGRGVDFDENNGFSIESGGPTSPPPPPPGPQRRYRGAEAPWARLSQEDVEERGETYVTPQNPRCRACGAEQPMPPPAPKVRGCLPSCPLYGKRLPSVQPPPFAPEPIPGPPKKVKGFGESGHTFHDATPMLDLVRAWEALERAVDPWLQSREVAEKGPTSPVALLRIEAAMEEAARHLRALRKARHES